MVPTLRRWADDAGAVAVEYALLLGVLALAALAGYLVYAAALGGLYAEVSREVGDALTP